MSKYTVKHFIEFFSAIPDEKWTVGSGPGNGCGCALDHAYSTTEQGQALVTLFARRNLLVSQVNDYGHDDGGSINGPFFSQATPKARIIAALEYLDL